jgi:MoxR-like ATPase
MKVDDFVKAGYVASATLTPGLTMTTPELVFYPYYDVVLKEPRFSTAYLTSVTDTDGTHVVLHSYSHKDGEPHLDIWCADKFNEGKNLDEAEARQRCETATALLPNKAKLVKQMMAKFNALPESARCDFWQSWRRDKTLCTHTSHVLAHLRDNVPDYQTKLEEAYDNATSGIVNGAPALGDTLTLENLAFIVPVLFEGERGAGKTVTARAFARTNGYKRVEFGGHEGIESPDMLGFLVPASADAMVWKDGPIAEAFRSARKQKTVLIIDELLRIRQRELSILLTALSPDEGVYRLRTGRIVGIEDGVAIEEELECPVENLCVVATTNVGSEYAVDDIDPALAERFVIIRKDTTKAELKRILNLVAAKLSVDLKSVDYSVSFFEKMTEMKNRGMVKHAPTTRTLVRAIELASKTGGTTDDVKRGVRTQHLLWVARNAEGHPVPEQVTDVVKLIERCFK